jgi:hypothetical protein
MPRTAARTACPIAQGAHGAAITHNNTVYHTSFNHNYNTVDYVIGAAGHLATGIAARLCWPGCWQQTWILTLSHFPLGWQYSSIRQDAVQCFQAHSLVQQNRQPEGSS